MVRLLRLRHRRYPRSLLVGVGAHICDTALVYTCATFSVAYITDTLDMSRSVALTGVVIFTCFVIVLQPVYGALSDRIGRRVLNLFSVVFTAVFAVPFFLLINTEEPVLIWLALVIIASLGLTPMIAVQPAFYAELFGARVRYTGFAASRELGAALAGFSPLVAFLASVETKHIDIGAEEPDQGTLVTAPTVADDGATPDGATPDSAAARKVASGDGVAPRSGRT